MLDRAAPTSASANRSIAGTDAFTVEGFGARILIRVNTTSIVPSLQARLPPQARLGKDDVPDGVISVVVNGEHNGAEHLNLVYGGQKLYSRTPSLDDMLEDYDSQLRFALALHSRAIVFIHAGVVGWRGRAAIFPGSTFSGKTSLVAALIAAGATYFSDEHALLDGEGRVHPWLKPLSVRDGLGGRQVEVPASAFGGKAATAPLPAGLIVATRYKKRARWNPHAIPASQGALSLLANALAARAAPERVLRAVGAAAAQARCYSTDRPEASRIAARLLALMDCSDREGIGDNGQAKC